MYYGLRENGELQPKLLHSITSTCPSQSLGKIPELEVAGAILMKTGRSPYDLAVRIPGFPPGGPGSTPGMVNTFLC